MLPKFQLYHIRGKYIWFIFSYILSGLKKLVQIQLYAAWDENVTLNYILLHQNIT